MLHHLPILLICAFFAILFLQSGLDKVFNYRDNLEYLRRHFAQSPLAGAVGFLMPAITGLETAAGGCSAIAVLQMLFFERRDMALAGLLMSAMSLLGLFLGQRLAKDYAGAVSLVPYFLASVLGINWVLG